MNIFEKGFCWRWRIEYTTVIPVRPQPLTNTLLICYDNIITVRHRYSRRLTHQNRPKFVRKHYRQLQCLWTCDDNIISSVSHMHTNHVYGRAVISNKIRLLTDYNASQISIWSQRWLRIKTVSIVTKCAQQMKNLINIAIEKITRRILASYSEII